MKKTLVTCIMCALFLPYMATCHEVLDKSFESLEVYPPSPAYNEGYLQVSELHSIYYAQFGNPLGLPVVVVHGGPGAGCADAWSSFFDPAFYRIIMFDQRGAGRSVPPAEMKDNTPQYSVNDMEALRNHLGVDKWLVFGGSWGTTLAIFYGETHPQQCLGFILRGTFLGRPHEYEHVFYGMKATFPEAWEEMVQAIFEEEREDLISAFHHRVMDPNPEAHLPAAHAFMRYDTICGSLLPNPEAVQTLALDDKLTLNVARAFIHYSVHRFFFTENQLLNAIDKISHLPAIIVHGRYDTICLPQTSYELHAAWKNSKLWFVTAGHFSDEPSISRGLREALDEMREAHR